MIQSYVSNGIMRDCYLRINNIIHAEIWDSDNGYEVALCSDDGIGYRESPEFYTIGQCYTWAKKYCPELEIK